MTYHHAKIAIVLSCFLAASAAHASADFIYAAREDGTVTRIDVATGVESSFGSVGSSAEGLAFDRSNNLYVTNTFANTITRFTPDGVGTVFAGAGLSSPLGLAFDAAGNLYVGENGSNTIDKITPDGVRSVFATTGTSSPYAMAFDGSGNLFVSSFSGNTIMEFTPGGVGSVFASTGLNAPVGLAFDGSGRLYAGNVVDHTITRFTPDGVGSLFLAPQATHTHLFAFQATPSAVPEPSSLIMLSIGGVGVGYLARNCRSRFSA